MGGHHGALYDEVEIEDMKWDASQGKFTYLCPCGDLFWILLSELLEGEDIARCPSCSLKLKVIADMDALEPFEKEVAELAAKVSAQ